MKLKGLLIATSFSCWVMSISIAYGQPDHLVEEVFAAKTEARSLLMGAKAEGQDAAHTENPIVKSYNSAADTILKTTKFLLEDAWYLISSPSRLDRKSAAWLGGILATFGVMYTYDQETLDAIHRSKDSPPYKAILKVGDFFEPAGLTT